MKKILHLIAISCLVISCKSTTVTNIDPIFKKPTILTDSIFMTMPGNLHYISNYLVLEDATAITNFCKVYDINGVWLRDIAPRGNASTEFGMPQLLQLSDDKVVITDMNRGNAVIYDIAADSAAVYNDINKEILEEICPTAIDEDLFVTVNSGINKEAGDGMLNIYDKNSLIKSFAKLPIPEKINNKFYIHQGFVGYNKNSETLVYSSPQLRYYAIFKRYGRDFKLVKENTYAEVNYEMKNGDLRIIKDDGEIIQVQALLKGYIVATGNSEEDLKNLPPKSGLMRDFTQLPRTLYLYDYEFNLKQVISTQIGILRVASNVDSNTLYLVNYIDGEFNISKMSID